MLLSDHGGSVEAELAGRLRVDQQDRSRSRNPNGEFLVSESRGERFDGDLGPRAHPSQYPRGRLASGIAFILQ